MGKMARSAPRRSARAGAGRRWFLRGLAGLGGTLAAAIAGVPLVGYLLGMRQSGVHWVPLGEVADFPVGQTRLVTFANPLAQAWDGLTAQTGVFVRYEGSDGPAAHRFEVFSVHCAHLGCPVTWFPQSGLFMCPCHGGVYYADGRRASGPPPRGLFRCVWQVKRGRLLVRAPHYPTLDDTLEDAV